MFQRVDSLIPSVGPSAARRSIRLGRALLTTRQIAQIQTLPPIAPVVVKIAVAFGLGCSKVKLSERNRLQEKPSPVSKEVRAARATQALDAQAPALVVQVQEARVPVLRTPAQEARRGLSPSASRLISRLSSSRRWTVSVCSLPALLVPLVQRS